MKIVFLPLITQTQIMKKFYPFLFYIFILLISSIQVLVFLSKDESIAKNIWPTFLTFSFYLFLAQINKKLVSFFLILSFVLVLFFYPTLQIYGKPDISYVASILYTNTAESISYIKVIPIFVWVLLLLYLVLTIFTIKLSNNYPKNKILLVISALLLLYSPLKRVYNYGSSPETLLGFYSRIPIVNKTSNLSFLTNDVIEQNNFVISESKKPSTLEIINDKDKKLKQIFVLVIGESVRKDFLNSYGFPINNTPFINNTPNIKFENFISVSFGTIHSLTRTLSTTPHFPNYELQNNIVNLAKKIGYKTYWISNQGQVGVWDSPNAVIAKSSDQFDFLKKGTSGDHLRIADENLIPFFHKAIAEKTDKPKFIVLHLIGSHPAIADRTNDQYDEYIVSKDISYYNKSIKNTDNLLHNVYKSIKNKHENSFNLIYFSDHGQRINKDLTITHGRVEKQVYEVPLLIWGNDILTKQQISATRNGRDFLTLFNQMHKVETNNVKNDYNFVSEDQASGLPYQIIGQDEKLTDYRSLQENFIPKFTLEKK